MNPNSKINDITKKIFRNNVIPKMSDGYMNCSHCFFLYNGRLELKCFLNYNGNECPFANGANRIIVAVDNGNTCKNCKMKIITQKYGSKYQKDHNYSNKDMLS